MQKLQDCRNNIFTLVCLFETQVPKHVAESDSRDLSAYEGFSSSDLAGHRTSAVMMYVE